MTNLDSILKSRYIILPTKVHIVKAMVFPVIVYGCESWTIRKTESRRIDAFELWCWRRLLREPVNEYSLEGLMLKLKLQYFGHLIQRSDSLEKTLILGNIEGSRRRGQQRMSWFDGSPTRWTWVWASFGSWWWRRNPGVLLSMLLQRFRRDWVTELNWMFPLIFLFSFQLIVHFFCLFVCLLAFLCTNH